MVKILVVFMIITIIVIVSCAIVHTKKDKEIYEDIDTNNTSEIVDYNIIAYDPNDTQLKFSDYGSDIQFCINNTEITFRQFNGKFDVVYDMNNCTEAAKTFFECMLPYLNYHIEEKARLLNEERISK